MIENDASLCVGGEAGMGPERSGAGPAGEHAEVTGKLRGEAL